MSFTSWVLGAVLTAAPLMFSQQATPAQQQPPQSPAAATGPSNNGPMQPGTNAPPNQSTMPPSDQSVPSTTSPFEQELIYGTGMTVDELRQAGYTDDQVSRLRTDSQALIAANATSPGGNQDQAPSAATSVSQPADPNADSSRPQQASSSNHTALWGLLGLLGLLGLAGRRRREVVVSRQLDTSERDRPRIIADRDQAAYAAREREIDSARNQQSVEAIDEREREAAVPDGARMAVDRDRLRDDEAAERAARDRELIESSAYRDQDIVASRELEDRRRREEMRERRTIEIRERERERRRTA